MKIWNFPLYIALTFFGTGVGMFLSAGELDDIRIEKDDTILSQQLELAKLTGKVEICEEDLAFLDDKNVFVHYDISEDLKRMIGEVKPETKEEVGEDGI